MKTHIKKGDLIIFNPYYEDIDGDKFASWEVGNVVGTSFGSIAIIENIVDTNTNESFDECDVYSQLRDEASTNIQITIRLLKKDYLFENKTYKIKGNSLFSVAKIDVALESLNTQLENVKTLKSVQNNHSRKMKLERILK